MRDHFVQAGVEVAMIACPSRGDSVNPIRLEVRAGRNHAHLATGPGRDRARILPGKGVQGPSERIAHRLDEHVVGDLAGGIAESARLGRTGSRLKPPRTRLIRRKARHANRGTTGVMLAVQRVVVGEHERAVILEVGSGVCSNGTLTVVWPAAISAPEICAPPMAWPQSPVPGSKLVQSFRHLKLPENSGDVSIGRREPASVGLTPSPGRNGE